MARTSPHCLWPGNFHQRWLPGEPGRSAGRSYSITCLGDVAEEARLSKAASKTGVLNWMKMLSWGGGKQKQHSNVLFISHILTWNSRIFTISIITTWMCFVCLISGTYTVWFLLHLHVYKKKGNGYNQFDSFSPIFMRKLSPAYCVGSALWCKSQVWMSLFSWFIAQV